MPSGADFSLLRFVALAVLSLAWGYGLLLRSRGEGRKFPFVLAGFVLALSVEYTFLFFWFLLFHGNPAARLWGLMLELLAAATVLGLWLFPPDPERLRRLLVAHGVGLAGVLLAGVAALWVPLGWPLRMGYGLVALVVVAWAYQRFRRRVSVPRVALLVALLFFFAGLAEALFPHKLEAQGILLGLVELVAVPFLWAWSLFWYPLRPPLGKDERSPSPPISLDKEDILALYLDQLDALLEAQGEQRLWDPVPFIVQTVLIWLGRRLGLHREPRTHLPLPHLLERAFERHEDDLARQGFRWLLRVDEALSVDPALGEWLLELALHYLTRHADPSYPVEMQLQSSRDLHRGPVLYVRLHHLLRSTPEGPLAPWMAPSLLLARLVLLDMGGDWWLDEDQHVRTLWLQIPLHGFGRILHAPEED